MCALAGVLLAMALNEWHRAWPLAALAVMSAVVLVGILADQIFQKRSAKKIAPAAK
jgi:hypothetical protein